MGKIGDFSFGSEPSLRKLLEAYKAAGFQASVLGDGLELFRKIQEEKASGCRVFLAFTANMVASGLRGIFAGMLKRRLVDAVITTGGSLDHDMIRAYESYELGAFAADDRELHREGINRIGNIFVPTKRYELLEEKMKPVFEALHSRGPVVSPSEIADEMGKTLSDEGSFLHWAHKNNIPVFSPGITDSAIGLQAYFFKQKKEYADFGIDVTKDMGRLAQVALDAEKAAGIVLGGGISKHHLIGVNLLRGGLDYALYVSTSEGWEGSLSGAPPSEAVSWGKIRESGRYVNIRGDATVVLPLLYYGAGGEKND